MSATVKTSRTGLRVVRRPRPTVDQAWATVLADLPAEVQPAMRRYAEAMRAEFDARSALSSLMTRHGLKWHQIDRLAHTLAYPD